MATGNYDPAAESRRSGPLQRGTMSLVRRHVDTGGDPFHATLRVQPASHLTFMGGGLRNCASYEVFG